MPAPFIFLIRQAPDTLHARPPNADLKMQAAAADDSRRPPSSSARVHARLPECHLMSCPACLRRHLGRRRCLETPTAWGLQLLRGGWMSRVATHLYLDM